MIVEATPARQAAQIVERGSAEARLAAGQGFELAAMWEPGGAVLAFGAPRVIRSIDPMPGRPDRLVIRLSGAFEVVCTPTAARRYLSPEQVAELAAEIDTSEAGS